MTATALDIFFEMGSRAGVSCSGKLTEMDDFEVRVGIIGFGLIWIRIIEGLKLTKLERVVL
jgi:hypothetical protein